MTSVIKTGTLSDRKSQALQQVRRVLREGEEFFSEQTYEDDAIDVPYMVVEEEEQASSTQRQLPPANDVPQQKVDDNFSFLRRDVSEKLRNFSGNNQRITAAVVTKAGQSSSSQPGGIVHAFPRPAGLPVGSFRFSGF